MRRALLVVLLAPAAQAPSELLRTRIEPHFICAAVGPSPRIAPRGTRP